MHRLTLLTMLALLLAPATALASPAQIYADCEDNGRLDKRYSDGDLREAQRDIPQDLDEYSNCRELIRGQLAGVETNSGGGGGAVGGSGGGGGSSAGGAPEGLPEGNGVGSVPLDGKGKPLDPLVDAQPDEQRDVRSAAAGEDIRPTSAGVRPGEPDGDLPSPLIVALILAGVATLLALAWNLKQLVVGRTA
jgi:hypothetical protein